MGLAIVIHLSMPGPMGVPNDSINLFDDNGNISASLKYNSGFAHCVSMKAILNTLKNAKY
jgi:hypothetical protein